MAQDRLEECLQALSRGRQWKNNDIEDVTPMPIKTMSGQTTQLRGINTQYESIG
jgi:hypothetical protein